MKTFTKREINRILKLIRDIDLVYIDLFCGAGGLTTGVESAMVDGKKAAVVVVCVNHDPLAILSHKGNHPHAIHIDEDIRLVNLDPIMHLVELIRKTYPGKTIALWASAECTNYSKAKGGQSRDADSRTLPNHLFRYLDAIRPDIFQIENVSEFQAWGPLRIKASKVSKRESALAIDKNGDYVWAPASMKNGTYYLEWVERVKAMGYDFQSREINSADHGAFTSRTRYFAQFVRPGLPISWPQATHSKKPTSDIFGQLKPWKPVREVLDFTLEGKSILSRKKPLSEKTLERIYAGLIKYVAGGKEHFIAKSFSGKPMGKVITVDQPASTVTTWGNQSLVKVCFLAKHYSGNPNDKVQSIDQPAGTVTCIDHHAKVDVSFLAKYYSGKPESMLSGSDEPAPTIRTKDGQALIETSFLASYYGTGEGVRHVSGPAPTVTNKDRFALVRPEYFLDKKYGSGDHNHQSVNAPAGSLTTVPKMNLIEAEPFILNKNSSTAPSVGIDKPSPTLTSRQHYLIDPKPWIMDTAYNNVGSDLDQPLGVITANRKYHYLVNPSWQGNVNSTDEPAPVVIARGDKAPLYLVETEAGDMAIIIFESDSAAMVKIKEFMAQYGIIDIKMRMLIVPELLRIQGFPEGYYLAGNQSDQKKFIGNAVEVTLATSMVTATAHGLIYHKSKAA